MLGHMKEHEEKEHEQKKQEGKKHGDHTVEDPTDLYTRGKFVQCGAGFVSLSLILILIFWVFSHVHLPAGFCFFIIIIRVWMFFFPHFTCADHQAKEGEHSKKKGAGHEGEEGSEDEEPKVLEIKFLVVFFCINLFLLLCPTIQQLVA